MILARPFPELLEIKFSAQW